MNHAARGPSTVLMKLACLFSSLGTASLLVGAVACGSASLSETPAPPDGGEPVTSDGAPSSPEKDGGLPDALPPVTCTPPTQDVPGAVVIGAPSTAKDSFTTLLAASAVAVYVSVEDAKTSTSRLLVYPRTAGACATEVPLPAGFVKVFFVVAHDDGSADVLAGKQPGFAADILHQATPTAALTPSVTIPNVIALLASEGQLYVVDSTYQLRTVANGSSTVIADLASATIGGTQYRNYRTVGPYLLASLFDAAPALTTYAWDLRVRPLKAAPVRNAIKPMAVLAWDGTDLTYAYTVGTSLYVRSDVAGVESAVLYQGQGAGAWMVTGRLFVAEASGKALSLVGVAGATKTPLSATAFASIATVDATGALATLPDGRWASVPIAK